MGEVKQIDIKNRTYYFYNNIIDIKTFESTLLKIDKNHSYKNIGINNIGYIAIKKIDDCEHIYSVNPLYLLINHASWYIEEKGVNKCLIFDSTDENKEFLKNMMFGMELETKSRKQVVASVTMKKITWKLNLILMINYH